MEFLYGGEDKKYQFVEGNDCKYTKWKEDNKWRQKLVVRYNKENFFTLYDEEVMLWEHLDLFKEWRGYLFPDAISMFLKYIIISIILSIISVSCVFWINSTFPVSYAGYIRGIKALSYVVAVIFAFFVPLFILDVRNIIIKRSRIKFFINYIKSLQMKSGNDIKYYREILEKISNSHSGIRSDTAKIILEKNLI